MDKMDVLEDSTATEEIDMEDLVTEDHSSPEDPLVNLTKAPIPNIPESQVGRSIKTKVDVSNVRNSDTSKMNVQLINPHEMKAQDQRSLKTTHILTQYMQINSVNPNFASAYDQALGIVKDSLNTANPLASLNL